MWYPELGERVIWQHHEQWFSGVVSKIEHSIDNVLNETNAWLFLIDISGFDVDKAEKGGWILMNSVDREHQQARLI